MICPHCSREIRPVVPKPPATLPPAVAGPRIVDEGPGPWSLWIVPIAAFAAIFFAWLVSP